MRHFDEQFTNITMLSAFILRRDKIVARRTQQALESSRDVQVAGVAHSIRQARLALDQHTPAILLTDLQLEDGAAVSLIGELRRRRAPAPRPKVLALATTDRDALTFATIVAGADNVLVDPEGHVSPIAAITRTQHGEAWLSAALARQVLGCLHALDALEATPPDDDRKLDWKLDATNPMKLSPGERRMLVLLAHGEPASTVAVRTGLSLEHVGRRIAFVYRKLQWDLRTGQLSVQAA